MASSLQRRFDAPASVQDSYVSGVEHLLQAQERQHRQQAKQLENMSRKAQQEAEVKAAWQHKEEEEERRMRAMEEERGQERRMRMEQSRRAAQYRRDRLAVASMMKESKQEAARRKVKALMERANEFAQERETAKANEDRRTKVVTARRTAAMKQSEKLQTQRRQQMSRKQEVSDALRRQKEQLRLLEAQIKNEEEDLRESKRSAARVKSAAEQTAKVRYYAARNAEKDAGLRRRQAAQDEIRRLRAEELQQRSEYVALHAKQAAERNEAERAAMRARLVEKAARSEALAAQREDLAAEMAAMRQQMIMQESAVKAGLERLRMSGAAFALPPELARALRMEVGPGAAGVQRHLVSWRTKRSTSVSPERAARHPRASLDDVDVRGSYSSGIRGGTRGPTRPYSASPSMGPGFISGATPRGADTQARKGTRGRWERNLPRYTTAGPIAPSTARRTELELRKTLQIEVEAELERQSTLSKVKDERERLRMMRIFGVEREMAKERILDLVHAVGVNVAVA